MSNEQPQNKGREIKVTVDNEQTKSLALELARANLLNEKLVDTVARKEVKDDHNDLATKKLQVYQKFNDSRALDCQTVEELQNFVTQKINDASRPIPAGSAPLNAQQYGQSDELWKRKFGSDKEMVDAILDQLHNGKTQQERDEAQSYYDKLLGVWVRSKRTNQNLDPFFDPNRVENLMPLKKTPEGFTVPAEKEGGDIGRLQKMWRAQRKAKMEEGVIQ